MFNWLRRKIKKTPPEHAIRIWGVVAGPFFRDEIEEDLPEGLEVMLVCKVEIDGEITVQEFFFTEFDHAYQIVKHFQSKIEPIEVSL